MEAPLEKIREVQKEAWNKSSVGWKKWDALTMEFMKPVGDEMIRLLNLKGNETVLDVATGTGEPGLSIAASLKTGKVIGIDLSEEMLAVAKENADIRGISNYETLCSDITSLPFEDNYFDAISCRFGFMFFPDLHLSLNEMFRVLKPDGYCIASVWNTAEKNSWISTSMDTMIRNLNLNPPAPGAPGMFRCAPDGLMAGLFSETGFREVREIEIPSILPCPDFDSYWNFITEVASPHAYSKAEPELKEQIKNEILFKLNQDFPGGQIALLSNSIIICGRK
jgi:ubiquinone/menaquinone biosynthesis C-methylase UbiE